MPGQACERSRRYAVDEYRSDHQRRRRGADQRPGRAAPFVHDLYLGLRTGWT